MVRPSLYDLDRAELRTVVAALGFPRYRADQVWHWLYRRLAPSLEAMHNVPRELRARLAEVADLPLLEPAAITSSADGCTEKLAFVLADGEIVETVLMHVLDPADEPPDADAEAPPVGGRHTVCLSTQAGCAMGCVFCATGQMGLLRDLTRGECVAQVVACARRLCAGGAHVSNVVFMGMGEPLANWEATWGAVETLTDPDGLGLSTRRLTISTVGIVPGIHRLAATRLPIRLAVSLHAPDDALRGRLVAVNAVHPVAAILDACRAWQSAGGRRLTVEYVLIRDVNDRPEQARHLAALLRGLRAHVNAIPLNPTAGSELRPSGPTAVAAFAAVLRARGVPVTVRMRRGIEIAAGCGQLRAEAADGRLGRTIAPSARPSVRTAARG